MPPKSNQGQGRGKGHDKAPDTGGFRNHGAEVSAAAHESPRGRGQTHGQDVSEIARGDVGAVAGDQPDAPRGRGSDRPTTD